MIWLAYIFLCRDIEVACDEKVVRDLETEERRAYSTALLNCSVHRRSIAACPLAFGEVGVKARIQNVMDYKKPAFWIVLIDVVVCIAVAVCFLNDPISDRSENVSADSRESAISEAILANYAGDRYDGGIRVESHKVIGDSVLGEIGGRPKTETIYLMVLYQEYSDYAGSLEEISGSYIPTAITFHVDSSGKYTLQEYWEPRDGSYYDDDIREKFPLLAQMKAFNHEAYIDELEAECLSKAQKIAERRDSLEEIHVSTEDGGVPLSELERIKDKLSGYMVEYKIATLDANEMTGMLDVELYERVEGLEELISQYLDLKYVKISMFEGELRLT